MTEQQTLARIFISESDRWQGSPLYLAIIDRCREDGIKGATVVRGMAGYGLHNRLHRGSLLRLSGELPLVVEIVDVEEKVRALLPELEKMMSGGLITLEEIEVFGQDGAE